MAHTLSIAAESGTPSLSLISGDYRLVEYLPKTPKAGADRVAETVVVEVSGTSADDLEANIHAIELMLQTAERYWESETGTKYYVNFAGSGATGTGRSGLFGGQVALPATTLASDWANLIVVVTITWEREPWWEMGGLSAASGTITCFNDGSEINYLDIDAVDLVGSYPAPATFLIEPASNDAYTFDRLYIHAIRAQQAISVLEGEDASGVTPTAASGYSGGEYVSVAISAGTDDELLSWPTQSNTTGSPMGLNGAWARFILCGNLTESGGPSGETCHVWVEILDIDDQVIWEGPKTLVNLTDQLYDLGVAMAPPNWIASGTISTYTIKLYARTAASTYSLLCDYVAVLPCEAGAIYVSLYDGAGYEDAISIDPNIGGAYFVEPGSNLWHIAETFWGGVWLTPGVAHRVFFTYRRDTAAGDTASDVDVVISYRPRRRTI